ncbi:MAG: ABC transporter substrate-binding protein [Thermoleophilia bacterium]
MAGCGSSGGGSGGSTASAGAIPTTPEAGTFRMGLEPWLGYGLWRVAEKKGIFSANGVDTKITSFNTDDEINAALASKQLDGANIATHTAMRLAAAGLPITIVMLLDQSTTADAILAPKTMTTVAALKGQKVAYEEGTTSDILLRYALSKNGMSIKDITKVPTPAADAGVAALAGRVAVAVTYEPYLTTALKRDAKWHLLFTAGQDPGLISDVFVVRNDVLKSKPGQVLALVKSWQAADAAYNADVTGGQHIIEAAVGSKPGELKTAFAGVRFYSVPQNQTELAAGGTFHDHTLTDVKNVATQAGLIKGTVDPLKLVDPAFVQAAK